MEFLRPRRAGGTAEVKQQLLGVGDAAGNLHIYDVPQNLWRPLTNERTLMLNFIGRETKVQEPAFEPDDYISRSCVCRDSGDLFYHYDYFHSRHGKHMPPPPTTLGVVVPNARGRPGNLHRFENSECNVECPLVLYTAKTKPTVQRVDYTAQRLELRTAEAEGAEADKLQNATSQPADAGEAADGGNAGEDSTDTVVKGLERSYPHEM